MSSHSTVSQGIVTKPSRHSVSDTLGRLENAIRTKGLTIFTLIDHSGEAEKVGFQMQDAKLLLFGSSKAGPPLMIASPLIALDLPLKALVWRDKDGKVWVSYNSVSYLADRYNLQSELTKNIAGIDAIIDSAL